MVWTYQTACTQSDLLQNSMSLKKQASCRAIMVLSSKVASCKTVNMLLHKQASCRTTEVLSHKMTFHSRCYYTEASCEICQVVVTQSDSLSAPPLSAVLTHCTTLSVSAVLTQCTTPFSCTLTYPRHHPFQLYSPTLRMEAATRNWHRYSCLDSISWMFSWPSTENPWNGT